MTLDNLQLALKLNNEILLTKIKDLNDIISSIAGTDLTNIKQEIKDLNALLENTKENIDSLNTTTITEINQRLDNIDTALDNIQNTSVPDLDKRIKDNLNSIKELAKSFSDLSSSLDTHIKNTVIHVTQEDKDLWNSILDNAKKYAKKLFDSVTSFNIQIVDALPVDNIKEMTIYFIRNEHDNESDYYEEYMYINNKWEIIGSTFVNLTPYLLKTDFEAYQQEVADKFLKYKTSDEINTILQDYLLSVDFNNIIQKYFTSDEITNILKDYAKSENLHEHKNKDILDLLSESQNGVLLYNNKAIEGGSNITISEEDNNAIKQKDDGIFVEDKTQEINNLKIRTEQINIAQKTINTELDYCVFNDGPVQLTVAQNAHILKNFTVKNTNMQLGDNNSILLKKNKKYFISCSLLSCDNGVSLYIVNALTNEIISAKGYLSTSSYNCTPVTLYINPTEDIYINVVSDATIRLWYDYSHLIVQEIGRMQTIDPVEYINTTQGIEDTPVGHIISHMGNKAPKHYLICDGTEYNITEYPYLAQHFKTEFGSYNYFGGDGVNTFAVPDLRGEFLRGTGENNHENQGSGVNVGEHQDATEHKYYYLANYGYTQYAKYTSNSYSPQDVGKLDSVIYQNGVYLHGDDGSWMSNSEWTSIPELYTSRPTNTSVLYCIKYEPTYYMTVGSYTVQGFEDYSEEEKIIGRWIDGRPIYRLYISCNVSAWNSAWKYDIVKNNYLINIKKIINAIEFASDTSITQCGQIYINPTTGSISAYHSSGYHEPVIGYLLEYTKSTDKENSFTPDMLSTIVMSGNKQEDLTEEELNNLITDTINLLNQ